MRILQIAPPWIPIPPPGYGGTELVIYNICKGLVANGHDVTLFATKNSQSPNELDYVFEKSLTEMDIDWTSGLPPLLHYHQAFKRASEFDMVHAHVSSGTDLTVFPFVSDCIQKGIPALITLHGHWPYDRVSYTDPYYLKFYGDDLAAINISQAMSKRMPKELRNAGVAYNSLDVSTLKYRAKPGKYLTWLGKIVPDKGLHEAILAAKEVKEQFVFGGVVEKSDKNSREYFATKVKPLIDDKQIIYLGPQSVRQKAKLMSNAKAFLNPINWEEPFGMVMIESMACGTPVISYNRGAAPELIKNGKTGFLVKNRREIVRAITKIDQIKRKDCRDHVEEKFSPIAAAKSHIEIYEKEIRRIKMSKPFAAKPLFSPVLVDGY